MGWGGGVGVLVGLAAPPLLAATAVGAAAGGIVGKFAEHKVASGLEAGLGEKLKPGTAAIIAIIDEEHRLAAEQALGGSPAKSVAPMDKHGLRGLKDALAEAAGKFVPDRTVLPIPDKTFGGTAGRTLKDSVADWSFIPGPKAPEDAPNVLVVLIDDAGFGSIDTFGGPVSTPAFSRVQDMGITYNRFHVTAVCSPTRAALLTGRNQHRVGFGSIAEYPGPFPGYSASKPRSCAAFPRILKENGYVTGGFGKWHLTPDNVQGAAGPFDHWPKSWGFDHWWGFLSGAAGQYDPIITQDDWTLGVPEGKDGELYYFPDDITDKAVEWLHAVRAQDAHKPWMVFYSTGCAHAPHHVAPEWADKYKGQFDDGWDALRERTLARQKELGIVPQDTELTERPDAFPAWDSLTDDQKKLYVRQMEVYCGLPGERRLERRPPAGLHRGDGRPRQHPHLLHLGRQRRQPGRHDHRFVQRDDVPQRPRARRRAAARSHRPVRRASRRSAATTPRLTSQPRGRTPATPRSSGASSRPATSAAPATRWSWRGRPASRPTGRCASQFTHCIDVGPTILEAAGIPEPKVVDGIEQEPMDGTSFLFTLDDAKAPERHTSQYFEMFAARAMYKDGWWAASRPDRLPWDVSPQTLAQFGPDVDWDPDRDVGWELYDLTDGLLAGARRRRRASREGRRAPGAVVAGGGAQPGAAAHGRHVGDLRHPAAAAHRRPVRVRRRRAEHPARHGAAHPGPLLRDRGRAHGSRGRRRRRDRRRRRLHRGLRAVGRRRRSPAPHLLPARRRDLQAGRHREAADRRRQREDAVRV